MDMQGNELDDFFRSSLDELEIQPSAHVWAGITNRLDADKRKRSLVSFLSIVAGIALAIAMGVLFIPKQARVNNPRANRIVKNVKQVTQIKPAVPVYEQQNKKVTKEVIASANHLAAVKVEKTNNDANTGHIKKLQARGEITKINTESQIGSVTRGDDLASATITDESQSGVTKKPVVQDLDLTGNKPQAVAVQAQTNVKTLAKKRRIHSVGDLFNVVIAAVDKRKDKVIEFSNTDEGDAVITGINLGIIKVKKEK
ncbi:hypothetical protein [Mucilaginibacter sp. 22184]|uniref:hypothetical protein n=1 Tax=Mucilaginibacter sp. 22184 TaxID=3453887 RepID=UPI003F87A3C7